MRESSTEQKKPVGRKRSSSEARGFKVERSKGKTKEPVGGGTTRWNGELVGPKGLNSKLGRERANPKQS